MTSTVKKSNFISCYCRFIMIGLLLLMLTVNPINAADNNNTYSKSRWQIEIYSGLAFGPLKDLNQFVNYHQELNNFFYDRYLDYLKGKNNEIIKGIQNWEKDTDGHLHKLTTSFPLGTRLRYLISQHLSLSLGLKVISQKTGSKWLTIYDRLDLQTKKDVETVSYDPFSISVTVLIPAIGIHLQTPLSNRLGIEGFLTAGPLFARCQYDYIWTYDWKASYYFNQQWNNLPSMIQKRSFNQEGSGTGVALELGSKLNYLLAKRMNLFIELGYAYQKATRISGSGYEIHNGVTEEWNGQWKIKEEKISTEWGTLIIEWPSNYWPEGKNLTSKRDFHLDLSGFRLGLGIGYGF